MPLDPFSTGAFLGDMIQAVTSFLNVAQWNTWVKVIRTAFYVVDVLLVVFLVFVVVQAWRYKPKFSAFFKRPKRVYELHDEKFKEHWQGIIKKTDADSPDAFKLAIIEADALVDDVLKRLGYPGETMAERLARLGQTDFAALNSLWKAHRVRNELTHTPGFKISQVQTKKTLENYEAFFKEIGLL